MVSCVIVLVLLATLLLKFMLSATQRVLQTFGSGGPRAVQLGERYA